MFVTDATSLPLFMLCNGSRLMKAALPDEVQDHTLRDEGNAAHWVAQELFEHGGDAARFIDTKAFNGYIITHDMVDYVNLYLGSLNCGQMEVETSHNGTNYQVNGRADHIKYDDFTDTLHVDDFKYGYGIVEPELNWTLISHAIGYFRKTIHPPEFIQFTIHQPRPYHPDGITRSWKIHRSKLLELENTLINCLNTPNDNLHSNYLCRKCKAVQTCPASRKAAYNAIDASNVALADDMPPDAISHELDILRIAELTIKTRKDAVEELAAHKIKTGVIIPGNALESRYGNSSWKKGITAGTIKAVTGVDVSKDGMVTPAEAKRRGLNDETVAIWTERPFIGSKLVKATADKQARRLLKKDK